MPVQDFLRKSGGNPYAGNANVMASIAGNSGFARPLVMAAMGEQVALSGQAQQAMSEKETAWKALETALKLAETNPQAANSIMETEAKHNPVAKQLVDGGVKFAGMSKKPWYMMTNQKTGEMFWFNVDKWMADGRPQDVTPYKQVISKAEDKKPDRKYKEGGRYSFTADDGFQYEGTYRGTGENGEPQWSKKVKKKYQTGQGAARTADKIQKDITTLADKINRTVGKNTFMQAVLGSSTDPAMKKLADEMKKDNPQLKTMEASLKRYLAEYRKETGTDFETGKLINPAPAQGAAPVSAAPTAGASISSQNNVSFEGGPAAFETSTASFLNQKQEGKETLKAGTKTPRRPLSSYRR